MKAQSTRRTRRRPTQPFDRLDLRIDLTQEEILADLLYPASARRPRRRA